jgi:hypothetical protein
MRESVPTRCKNRRTVRSACFVVWQSLSDQRLRRSRPPTKSIPASALVGSGT